MIDLSCSDRVLLYKISFAVFFLSLSPFSAMDAPQDAIAFCQPDSRYDGPIGRSSGFSKSIAAIVLIKN